MASPAPATSTSALTINIFDGTRQPFQAPMDILYRITDGNGTQLVEKEIRASSVRLSDLPFYDNFGDNYTILTWAKGYQQAGFTPVKLSPQLLVTLDLMLIPKDSALNLPTLRGTP